MQEAKECYELGIQAIALFPVIDQQLKSEDASEAYNDHGLIPKAIKELKKQLPNLGIIFLRHVNP